MKTLIAFAALLPLFVFSVAGQSLSNETIMNRIRAERADKTITLTFDPGAKTSKIMAVSDNFVNSEASQAGIDAMNFAIGFFYAGKELTSADSFQLTFWVLTKKPRFAGAHDMTVILPDEMLVIGSGRYISKPRDEVEYLNFDVSREALTKIASQNESRFQLGDKEFTFTRSQMKLLADLLVVTAL